MAEPRCPSCPNCGDLLTESSHQTVCLVNLTRELERHRTAVLGVKAAFEATFQPDFGGVDWRDDAAIQSFANIFGRIVYRELPASKRNEETP